MWDQDQSNEHHQQQEPGDGNNGEKKSEVMEVAQEVNSAEAKNDKPQEIEPAADNALPEFLVSEERENFQSLYETSLRNIQEGEVVKGTIVHVGPENVMVDVGYKSEGEIPLEEFKNEDGSITIKEGDVIDVLLEVREDDEGVIILSKDKADKIKIWEEIAHAYETDGVIQGKIIARIKGGLSVDVGVLAFLPGSQVDLRPVRNLEKLIGQTAEFSVLKFNRKRSNVVLSRRKVLEREREILKAEALKRIREGEVMEGVVKNITEYGAFIDLGGLDGLLHITDMSWGRINYPKEVLDVGDTIQVKVLKYDQERERVSLGLKQMTPDPWERVDQIYPVGSRPQGKVVNITDYGAFVELEPGVEGLVHVSEMSWAKKPRHPSRIVSVGDMVEVCVLNLDIPNRRISLGMKQVMENPWTVVAAKYQEGTKIAGRIRNITDFGIFIGLDEGIDGLVHISDISWNKRIKHPSEIFKKGQEVEAIVLNVDQENERFSLGIKQLEEDPWESIPMKYKGGTVVTGVVTNITDFGVFLEIEEGVEGLIHISELSKEKIDNPEEIVKVGDKISAVVLKVNKKERKIGLSIKEMGFIEGKGQKDDYIQTQETATTSMGAILREEIEKRQQEEASLSQQDQHMEEDQEQKATTVETESDSMAVEITEEALEEQKTAALETEQHELVGGEKENPDNEESKDSDDD